VVGASPHDPNSLPHPGLSYLDSVRAGLPGKLRIGYSPDLGYAVVQSDIAAAVEDGVRVFEKLGHRVERFAGGPPLLGRDWAIMNSFELAARLYRFLPQRENDIGRALMSGIRMGAEMTPEFWGRAAEQRAELNRWCADIFERYDILVTPTVPYDPPPARGPFPEETEGRKQVIAGVAAFTIPFNLSGHPAATVRAGLSRAKLPIGLHIVGPRHRDDLVLQAARAFERERPWHPEWPLEF
jgi:aspartyl-tRNA(Asn)/glutamyl-tRNA(Gln) amidotransferase subunit A